MLVEENWLCFVFRWAHFGWNWAQEDFTSDKLKHVAGQDSQDASIS